LLFIAAACVVAAAAVSHPAGEELNHLEDSIKSVEIDVQEAVKPLKAMVSDEVKEIHEMKGLRGSKQESAKRVIKQAIREEHNQQTEALKSLKKVERAAQDMGAGRANSKRLGEGRTNKNIPTGYTKVINHIETVRGMLAQGVKTSHTRERLKRMLSEVKGESSTTMTAQNELPENSPIQNTHKSSAGAASILSAAASMPTDLGSLGENMDGEDNSAMWVDPDQEDTNLGPMFDYREKLQQHQLLRQAARVRLGETDQAPNGAASMLVAAATSGDSATHVDAKSAGAASVLSATTSTNHQPVSTPSAATHMDNQPASMSRSATHDDAKSAGAASVLSAATSTNNQPESTPSAATHMDNQPASMSRSATPNSKLRKQERAVIDAEKTAKNEVEGLVAHLEAPSQPSVQSSPSPSPDGYEQMP